MNNEEKIEKVNYWLKVFVTITYGLKKLGIGELSGLYFAYDTLVALS